MQTNKVKVTCIENIFDPHKSQKIKEFPHGLTIGELITNFNPVLSSELEVVVAIDGIVCAEDKDTFSCVPKQGSSVVFSVVPKGGGGGGGKNPLKMIALLAIAVVAWYAGPQIASLMTGLEVGSAAAAASTAFGLISATASVLVVGIGGLLVNSIFGGPPLPDLGSFNGGGGISSTPTYSWDIEPNPQEQGIVVPVLYGKMRVVPPIINAFVTSNDDKQTYNALYCIADHKIDSVSDMYINANPAYNFEGIVLETKLGETNQGVIPAFSNTISDKAVGFKLDTDWKQTETSGNAVQGIGVGISLSGLFYANNSGGLDSQTVTLNIQYREKGTEIWYSFFDSNDIYTSHIVETERWSAGYYRSNSQWVELEEGSAIFEDHIEGDRYTSNEGDSYWRWLTATHNTTTSYYKPYADAEVIVTTTTTTVYPTIYIHSVNDNPSISITEATQSEIKRDYFVSGLTPGQYEVRVKLAEELPTGTRYRNTTYFSYIQEIIYDEFTYPGTALAGVQALATDQLSGSRPAISFIAERNFVDVWTGTEYEQKPADNPAWVIYDILHNPIYGASTPVNRFIYDEFEEWANYCEEKNYKCNIYISDATSVRNIMDTVSVLGRGAVVHKGSQFGVIIDKEEEMAVQHFMFTKGNVLEGTYSNAFLNTSDRANSIEITYFDKNIDYTRQIVELYQNGYDEAESAINKNSVTLLGCTDRDQAIQYGRASLLRNRYLTQTVSFEAGVDSIACFPGQVIDLSFDVPQWGLSSGRLSAATSNTVTLPEAVELVAGEQYTVQIKHSSSDDIEWRNVIPVSTTTTTKVLNLTSAWTTIPVEYDLYAFGRVNNVTKKFRVISITRANDTLNRKITAIEYVPEIYADNIDNISQIEIGDTAFVTDLFARENWVFSNDGTGKSVIDVTWKGNALSWNVFIKENNGLWENVGKANTRSFRIDRAFSINKTYSISVTPYNIPNNAYTKSITILGKEAPPSDVSNFVAVSRNDAIILTWDHIEDVDLLGYTIVVGPDYNRGNIIAEGISENRYVWNPPVSGTYNFFIKAKDRSFHLSPNAATTSITVDLSQILNIVINRDEIPDYVAVGDSYNLYYSNTEELLKWLPGLTDTEVDAATTDTSSTISLYDGNSENGSFTSDVIDLGVVSQFTLRQSIDKTALLLNPTDQSFIYGRTDLTFPLDTDTSITSLAKHVLYYKYSDDNTTWSDWYVYQNIVTLNTRYLQIKAMTDITITATSFEISSINTLLDVDEKSKKLYNQTIADTGTEFLLSSIPIDIFSTYNVGVTVLGSGFAAYSVDIQSDRFTVYLYDSSGSGISRNVNLEIVGF